jgi:hypothetical protein
VLRDVLFTTGLLISSDSHVLIASAWECHKTGFSHLIVLFNVFNQAGPGTVFCDHTTYIFMFLAIATSNLIATALAQKVCFQFESLCLHLGKNKADNYIDLENLIR